MNKGITIAIVVVVLLASGYWVWQQKAAAPSASDQQIIEQNTNTSSVTSLRNLMQTGLPVRCQYSHDIDGVPQTGTMYVAGQKLRGEFVMTEAGSTMNGSVIYDDEYVYSWGTTAQGTFGTKFKLAANEASPVDKQTDVDLDQQIDFNCQPWQVDDSKFTPPVDVEFRDLSQTSLQPAINTNEFPANDKCAVCGQLTDDANKAQCQKAFGC